MATDSAELTFVRCRSCGALVPATATKCRICNAALDGAGKLDEGGDRGGSRVRQRTMSAPSGDLMDAVQKLRDEEPSPMPDEAIGETNGSDEADPVGTTDDDPLGAYLEEVEEGGAASKSANGMSESEGDDDLGLDDPLDDDDLGSTKPFGASSDSRDSGGGRPFAMGSENDLIDEPPPIKKPVSPFVRPSGEEGRRGGSRFDRPADRGGRDKRDDSRGGREAQGRDRGQKPSRSDDARSSQQNRSQAPVQAAPSAKSSPIIQSSAPKGRLVGWLVSYSESEGSAIELREGKYFVTGSSFKGTDLVVEDPSVSTPHALLSVSTDNGIRAQDLMSENGIFSKNGGGSDFQRTEGPVTLRHGDWIRFGTVEFLVCTVARGDAK